MQKILIIGLILLVGRLNAQEKLPAPVEPAPPKHTETGTGTHTRMFSFDFPTDYNVLTCLDKICPIEKDSNFLSVHLKKAYQKAAIPPQIDKLFSKLEKHRSEDKSAKEILATPIDLSLVPKDAIVRAMLNLNYAMGFADSLKFKDTPNGPTLDVSEMLKELESKNVAEETRNWVTKSMAHILTPEHMEIGAYYQRLSARDLVGRLGKTENDAVKSIAQTYETVTKRMKEYDSSFTLLEKVTGSSRKDALFKKIAEGKAVDEHEFVELMEIGITYRTLLAVTEKGSPFLEKLQISLEKAEIDAGSREKALEQMARLIAQMEAKKTAEYAACRANYIAQRELLPDDANIAKITNRFNEAKVDIKQKLLKRYSETTSARIGQVIDAFKIYPPPHRNGLDQRFERTLQRAYDTQAEAQQLWKDLSAEEKTKLASSVYALLLVMGEKTLTNVDRIDCEGLYVNIISDAAINGNSVTTGALHSVIKESDSKQIMLHELGHIVSQNIRKGMASSESFGSYKKTRECLREWHSEKASPRQKEDVDGNEPYQVGITTEEDYADWASAIAQPKSPGNFACQFLDAAPDGKSWLPIDIRRAAQDTHSSPLFRLIALEKLRGQKIPEVCLPALKADSGKEDIDTCL